MGLGNRHFVSFSDHPIIYGRVPKVANSSVKEALTSLLTRKYEGDSTSRDIYWRIQTNGETKMLSPGKAWKLRRDKYIFAFVRNPIDRIVSSYNNKVWEKNTMPPSWIKAGFSVKMDFEEFLQRTVEIPNREMDVHLMPQSEMLLHNGLIVPRFVGHFEDMANQWRRLQRLLLKRYQIGIPDLPQINVRRQNHDDINKYFKKDILIELMLQKYAKDIEIFYAGVSADRLVSGEFTVPTIERPVREAAGPAGAVAAGDSTADG